MCLIAKTLGDSKSRKWQWKGYQRDVVSVVIFAFSHGFDLGSAHEASGSFGQESRPGQTQLTRGIKQQVLF